jgi:hypothetical protein
MNAPDYQAALKQGQGAIDSSAAAKGGLFGGAHTKDTIAFGSDLASQYLNNYRSSLFQQAGMGQNAAAGLGGLGQSSANAIGNAYGAMGDARATAYNNQAQLYGGIAGSLSNLANNYFAGRSGSSYGPNSGSIYANQVRTGPGSVYNFGNNMGNFVNTGWGG